MLQGQELAAISNHFTQSAFGIQLEPFGAFIGLQCNVIGNLFGFALKVTLLSYKRPDRLKPDRYNQGVR
jgi:hypothetical protein